MYILNVDANMGTVICNLANVIHLLLWWFDCPKLQLFEGSFVNGLPVHGEHCTIFHYSTVFDSHACIVLHIICLTRRHLVSTYCIYSLLIGWMHYCPVVLCSLPANRVQHCVRPILLCSTVWCRSPTAHPLSRLHMSVVMCTVMCTETAVLTGHYWFRLRFLCLLLFN